MASQIKETLIAVKETIEETAKIISEDEIATPILKYKPDLLNIATNQIASEFINVEIRTPDKPTHRKVIKVVMQPQESTKTSEGAGLPAVPDKAKQFVFNLEKRAGSTQWGFPEREVKPIIKGKKVDQIMKEALYGVKLKTKDNLGFDPHKVYNFGEPGCGTWRGLVQDFTKIRNYHLKRKTLFEDPVFPADLSSITYSGKFTNCYWARPKEIDPDAKLFVEGFSRFDIIQGSLGDCWLLASIGTLTQRHNLFLQVVPLDQSFMQNYAGIFHFRFWQYGRWIDIVIDDRLPVNNRGELLFTHSTSQKEFWPALLEKAYAKLHGSYEALAGGMAAEAMEDFTGGITEIYETPDVPENFFKILKSAFYKGSLITMTIEARKGASRQHVTEKGLVEGHAYTVSRVMRTTIKDLNNKSMEVELVRLRNPWGKSNVEWNGAWSQRSDEWCHISSKEKERVGLNFDYDGEFWMSYEDFIAHANYIDICNLNPESTRSSRKWDVIMFEGEWVAGVTAGGCCNNDKTFANNPQYLITLDEPDTKNSDICTIVVNLMQKNMTRSVDMGKSEHAIGIVIYAIKDPETAPKPLNRKYLYNHEIFDNSEYESMRSVSKRFELPMGTYCIIPTTFDPDECAEYLLRIFSARKMWETKAYEEEVGFAPQGRICMCPPIDVHLSSSSMDRKIEKPKAPLQDKDKDKDKSKVKDTNIEKDTSKEKDKVKVDDKEKVQTKGKDKQGVPKGKTELSEKEYKKYHPEPPKMVRESFKVKDNSAPPAPNADVVSLASELSEDINIARTVSIDQTLQEEIENTFLQLSGDDEEINWEDLQKLLDIAFKIYPTHKTFNSDLCRSLLALYDENQSGKLSFEEFVKLCKDVGSWTVIFNVHAMNDGDKNGGKKGDGKRKDKKKVVIYMDNVKGPLVLNAQELRSVIKEAGFTISNHILNLIYYRYGNGSNGFEFEDVLMSLIRIKSMINGFADGRVASTDMAEFSIDEFMNLVMYS